MGEKTKKRGRPKKPLLLKVLKFIDKKAGQAGKRDKPRTYRSTNGFS